MSARKFVLWGITVFLCWFLWNALVSKTDSAFWPGIVCLVAIQLIPEKRMDDETFLKLVEAWKGKS